MANPHMQQALIEEAREYLRSSRRKVTLDASDVVIHRGLNGWVAQTPDAEGYLSERMYEDRAADGGDAVAKGLFRLLRDFYPDVMNRVEEVP